MTIYVVLVILKWRIYVLMKSSFFSIWRKLVLTKIKQFTVYLHASKKLLQLLLIIKFKTHYKCLKFSLTLTLLLTLLMTYFRFGGWRYTLFVLTNQNHCYMQKLNDIEITLSVCLSVQSKLNLNHNFWAKRDAFLLHKCIPCDKNFLLIWIFWLFDLDLDFWPTFE